MAVKLTEMRLGSKVMVRGGFGSEPAKEAIVNELDSDIKNGRPGIGYEEVSTGDGRWAYLDQVVKVLKY